LVQRALRAVRRYYRPVTAGSSAESNKARENQPAATAPTIGATQKRNSCSSAQPPTNSAGPVLRAGFTDVLVTGMLIRWISVSARPIARPAKPAGPQTERHRRIEVAAGDRPERIGAGQHRQAERQRDAGQSDAELRKRRGQHGAAAATEDEPEGAEAFGGKLWGHGAVSS
jgi:hypothetical protein